MGSTLTSASCDEAGRGGARHPEGAPRGTALCGPPWSGRVEAAKQTPSLARRPPPPPPTCGDCGAAGRAARARRVGRPASPRQTEAARPPPRGRPPTAPPPAPNLQRLRGSKAGRTGRTSGAARKPQAGDGGKAGPPPYPPGPPPPPTCCGCRAVGRARWAGQVGRSASPRQETTDTESKQSKRAGISISSSGSNWAISQGTPRRTCQHKRSGAFPLAARAVPSRRARRAASGRAGQVAEVALDSNIGAVHLN